MLHVMLYQLEKHTNDMNQPRSIIVVVPCENLLMILTMDYENHENPMESTTLNALTSILFETYEASDVGGCWEIIKYCNI